MAKAKIRERFGGLVLFMERFSVILGIRYHGCALPFN